MNDYYFKEHLVMRVEDPHIEVFTINTANLNKDFALDTTLFVASDTKNMDRLEADLNALLHTYINNEKLCVYLINAEKTKIYGGIFTKLPDAMFVYRTNDSQPEKVSSRFLFIMKTATMTKDNLKLWIEQEMSKFEKLVYVDPYKDAKSYVVVTNEEQLKIWPASRVPPSGWVNCMDYSANLESCMDYIGNNASNYQLLVNQQKEYKVTLAVYPISDDWEIYYSGEKQECLDEIQNFKQLNMSDEELAKLREEEMRLAMEEEENESKMRWERLK